MFYQVRVPILGIVENMSYLICPRCSERIDVFSRGVGHRTAEQMQVHFLGELPLNPEIRIGGDTGRPIALRDGNSGFLELARNTVKRVDVVSAEEGSTLEITD